MSNITAVPKQDIESIAKFYNVPEPIARMMFAVISDTLYPKIQFLLYQAHKKGVQRVELSPPKEISGEWVTEAKVFPSVPQSLLMEIVHLPEDERKSIWNHYSAPTVEWGRASKENVSNQNMHKWLPEMSRKRAAARALRLFAGIGLTSYEEMPEAILTKEELETEGDAKVIRLESAPSTPVVAPAQAEPEVCACGCPEKPHIKWDGKTQCMACQNKVKGCTLKLP